MKKAALRVRDYSRIKKNKVKRILQNGCLVRRVVVTSTAIDSDSLVVLVKAIIFGFLIQYKA